VCVLEAIRAINPRIRFYQASTAEMFRRRSRFRKTKPTPFYPRSPYGAAKLYAHWMTVNLREAYGIFASSGILFNHESPLRGPEFCDSQDQHRGLADCRGIAKVLELGNLGALRDWGYAAEYVEGMWRVLQAQEPDTYVLATIVLSRVRDYATLSFKAAGIDIDWVGTGEQERVS